MGKLSTFVTLLLASNVVLSVPISENTATIGGIKGVVWPKDRPLPVKVTKLPSGQRVGWVKRSAQLSGGDIASPPAPIVSDAPFDRKAHVPKPELLLAGVPSGPEGTVPFQIITVEELSKVPSKQPPPSPHGGLEKRANPHYYGNSNQGINNWGGSAVISLFAPYVTNPYSMSLIQVAVANVQQGYQQTAELGWQVLPALYNNDTYPHIFTYYTTNGYKQEGDNLGGYNALEKGWVQVDKNYFPGMTFAPASTVGGTQYEVSIAYQLSGGNWWVNVNNVWMGYYPASLYAKNGSTTKTLGANADQIAWYGEIADFYAPPKSDMGSGQFAKTGFGKSAYMHNILTYSTPSVAIDYNGAFGVSNASWYTVDPHMKTTEQWKSYFFVGGPGAG